MADVVRFIGIDPGLNHTGWAVIDVAGNSIKYVASGVINPDSKETLAFRLGFLYSKLQDLFDVYKPDKMGIEKTFVNQNPTSTLLLGHARAVPIIVAGLHLADVLEFEPNVIKKAVVGYGHASKDQMMKMIALLMPGISPKTADEADAMAIAYTASTIKKF